MLQCLSSSLSLGLSWLWFLGDLEEVWTSSEERYINFSFYF